MPGREIWEEEGVEVDGGELGEEGPREEVFMRKFPCERGAGNQSG